MRLLIVNADDFGLNDAATDGILDAHAAGAVTSTTMMVNAPGAERAVALARAQPRLAVGLHFNLTWGSPVAPLARVRALVDGSGRFLSRGRLARRLFAGLVPRAQIREELEAQLARFRELGLAPSHIDSHQHVHGFGSVFDAVAACCADQRLPMRVPWVGGGGSGGPARRLRRGVLRSMLARATRRWQGRVRWNDGLGSVFDETDDAARLDDAVYRRILGHAGEGSFELMVHPVTSAAAMEGYTRIGGIAEAEWRWLREGRLPGLAAEAGFGLGSYADLR